MQTNYTAFNVVDELAYGVAIAVAYRIAQQALDGDEQGAANDYHQHCTTLDTAAKAEFDRLIATAAANLQARISSQMAGR